MNEFESTHKISAPSIFACGILVLMTGAIRQLGRLFPR